MEDLSFWSVFDAVAGSKPDSEYLVTPHVRRTYGEVRDRAHRFAAFLNSRGVEVHRPRSALAGHESGQDHIGVYMGNRAEYVESLLGILAARGAPANVNYRYVAAELDQLITECGLTGLVYEADFAPVLAKIPERVTSLKVLVEVGGSGEPLLPGAVAYESIVGADGSVPVLAGTPAPDDVCLICTGGTTGLPKAVLWRQCDLLAQLIGDTHLSTGKPVETLDDLVASLDAPRMVALIASPLMHFAGVGVAVLLASAGATLVLADPPRGFDPASTLSMIERERVQAITIVGDAFAWPLIEEARRRSYDTSSLMIVQSGGSAFSARAKRELTEALGGRVMMSEGLGSSEAGLQARSYSADDDDAGVFAPDRSTRVLDLERTREIEPPDPTEGWLATVGRTPLGYLGREELTAKTFPTIDGRRYSVPGDLAHWRPDGRLQLLGRAATTINSGGEKIFADEVEHALRRYPEVVDLVVVGRPSRRWGSEVVALVVPASDRFDRDDLLATASESLARYKLPKDVIVVDRIARTPVGKVDYDWARATACAPTSATEADPATEAGD